MTRRLVVGLLKRIRQGRYRFDAPQLRREAPHAPQWLRRCRFEQMESRQLLSVNVAPIDIGAVYYEDAGGDDLVADRFEVTFDGGAAGTQLTEFVIETDKNSDGDRDEGECFFDTEPGGNGVFGAVDIEILEQDGFTVTGIFVEDGGDTLRITLAGFDAGEKLVFSVDVDEQGFLSASSLAEGNEFEGSRLGATFEAEHYAVASGMDVFLDYYDDKLVGTDLALPSDDYVDPPAESLSDRTAGAVFALEQTPLPITISGRVYEDANLNYSHDTGEDWLGGVELTLYELVGSQYVATGLTTTTNSSGYYEFNGAEILPGTYKIVETQPSGYLSVGAMPGTVDGNTRGIADGTDILTGIVLEGGDDSIHNDFGEVRPASLSGHVYHDANDNGVFDTTETGIGGAAVQVVSDDTGATIDVVTDANGYWSVDNLMPGEYHITETTPDGYLDGKDAAGTLGGVANNPGDLINKVNVGAGENGEDYDFGELLPGGLCGYVYVDANNNGLRDDGEVGIAGVELTLLDGNGTPTGRTATTDADGHYCFPDLAPGTYGIAETHPTAYVDGLDTEGTLGGVAHNPGDLIDQIVVGSGQKGMENNFGEREFVGISGYVYVDADNDGVRDAGEQPIAGVQLTLLDSKGNSTGLTTTTDAKGYYEFLNLEPGVYGVSEVQPTAYYDGLDVAGDAGGVAHNPGDLITGATLEAGLIAKNYNFGELEPARLQGTVFVDLDGDLMPDSGETRLGGVTVYLLDSSGERIGSTKTDTNGEYRFDNLEPGTYGVEEVQPANYLDGDEKVGSAGGVLAENDLMNQIVLDPGAKGVDYNFCEVVPATISGYVFQDGPTIQLQPFEAMPEITSIRDGEFTSDDTPLAGVVLELRDQSGDAVLDKHGNPITTTTNAQGYYEFSGLRPGTYIVTEVQPDGYIDAIDTAGSLGGIAANTGQLGLMGMELPTGITIDLNSDAIVQIMVSGGEEGVSYNFSEVQVQRAPYWPTPDPRPTPDPLPDPVAPGYRQAYTPYAAPVAVVYEMPAFYGGSGTPLTYTWHLSVINAGQPRRFRTSSDQVALQTNHYFNPVSWEGSNLRDAQWIIADNTGQAEYNFQFGVTEGIPVVGDWNGDGVDEIGVFVDGEWFLDINGNGVWDDGDLWAKLGDKGDLPVTGDWDGDGKTDIGIFGQAWIGDPRAIQAEAGLPDSQNAPNGGYKNLPPDPQQAPDRVRTMKRTAEGRLRADLIDHVFEYGKAGDKAIAGDWNGDGVSSIGIFRNGDWFLDVDGNGKWSDADLYIEFGHKGDLPVVGDFNHDGVDDIGVYRKGKWYLDTNGNHQIDAQDKVFALGGAEDLPITGDFDGDGVDQIGVYRAGPTPDRQASVD